MSSVFMGFVDEMLASTVVAEQPRLVACLSGCTKRILALANEVVGPEEGEEEGFGGGGGGGGSGQGLGSGQGPGPGDAASVAPAAAPAPAPVPSQPDPPVYHDMLGLSSASSTSPPALSSAASSSEDTADCDLHLGSDAAHQSCHTARTLALPAPPGVTENIPEPITPPDLGLSKPDPFSAPPFETNYSQMPPQIYGNGWSVTTHPILGPNSPQYWGPRVPLAPGSFAFRLAKASLTIAYLILSKNHHPPLPLSEEHRIFGHRLCYRGRDDLLIRLRWLLGPGAEYMYRVVDLPYGQHGDQVFTRGDLDPAFDELGWPAITRARSEAGAGAKFLSILGVEKQLLALGGRIVDAETLELNIANPAPPPPPPPQSTTTTTGPPGHTEPPPVSSQPDSWSFVDFYSPNQPQPQPQVLTMQLSMGLLVSNLARSAVCLMRGPGYPRDSLGAAIQASITKVV